MTEEIIYCPSCNHKLRVPEELLGQTVQCPLCALVFVTPVRSGPQPAAPVLAAPPPVEAAPRPLPSLPPRPEVPTDPDQRQAAASLRLPAIVLLIVGCLGWLANACVLVVFKIAGPEKIASFMEVLVQMAALPAEQKQEFRDLLTSEDFYRESLVKGFVFLLVSTGVIVGGTQMLRRRGYAFAILGSVLAMINIQNCCCVLGLPVGIWSLIVLLQPEVRRVFE
jgi:hypothetical protein